MADRTEQFLTVEQAARRLHVHPMTVRRHLKSGLLRGRKQGKLWRVAESALNETTNAAQTDAARADSEKREPSVSPLLRALALIQERDAQAGHVPIRRDGNAASDVRAVREAQTPETQTPETQTPETLTP